MEKMAVSADALEREYQENQNDELTNPLVALYEVIFGAMKETPDFEVEANKNEHILKMLEMNLKI